MLYPHPRGAVRVCESGNGVKRKAEDGLEEDRNPSIKLLVLSEASRRKV